ncbi:MAG: tetraacyldisaccharide 4'-kinase [Fibrobacter sp.]|nr:tetraacyldisaccharide 4'-kinase [Fibrobacter sp.]
MTPSTVNPLRLVAAVLYRIGYKLHHKLFLRPQPPLRIPVFIVGSYLTGGAGKTPFTIWLAKRLLEQGKKVAVLCHSNAWDELILLQNNLAQNLQASPLKHSPSIKIFSTKNRYATAKEIQDKFDIILCDDGFEDSRFTGACTICLDWQKPPRSVTDLLPAGKCRSLEQDHHDSQIVHLDCYGKNGATPDIHFSIESLTNYIPSEPLTATAICGLGSPERFIKDLRDFGINIEKKIIRPDHDKQFTQVIEAVLSQGKHIVVSQKDACRLPQPLLTNPKLHVTVQKITISKNAQEIMDRAINTQTL